MPRLTAVLGALLAFTILFAVALSTSTNEITAARGGGNGGGNGIVWEGYLQLIQHGMDTAEPPDGQPHAYNNTTGGTTGMPCAWNDEDEVGLLGRGNLGAGDSTSASLCMVADLDCCNPADYPKFIYSRVYVKPTANLKVWVTLDGPVTLPDSRVVIAAIDAQPSFLVNWTGSGTLQEYQLCGPDAVAHTAHRQGWQELTYWPQIPSSGGYGMQVSYTIHLQNLDKQSARNINAYFSISFNDWDKTDSYSPYIQRYQPPDTLIPCPNIP